MAYLTGMVLNGLVTDQGPFVSPLPTDLKLHVQVQEATTRTKKKKNWEG